MFVSVLLEPRADPHKVLYIRSGASGKRGASRLRDHGGNKGSTSLLVFEPLGDVCSSLLKNVFTRGCDCAGLSMRTWIPLDRCLGEEWLVGCIK